ncbi:MAG TPA: hypothetical protein VM911_10880 [Pyrinomonadaceae bacterium]|nr:hypothetical protein [Pyrinomonadaceae bacterium]
MADRAKTFEQLIAEAPPSLREDYTEAGGLESILQQPLTPERALDRAAADGQSERDRAQFAREAREREQRKAQIAQEAEERAREAHALNNRAAAEAEAQLMARLRAEYPPMTDAAWNQQWPSIRAQHFAEEHQRRMHAERNNGEVLGEMRGVESF